MVDTDPGVDDALALMLAVAATDTTVEAVTVAAGNVGLPRTVANACTVLDVLQLDPAATPVFAGCARSLVGPHVEATVHGKDGLGDARFPPSPRPVETEHASLALVRLASRSPGALTLVALGPLTNLALALGLDPDLPRKYQRLVVMGGAVRATGNMPNPSTEFNIACDPEAAAIVLDRWPGLVLVPWETVLPCTVDPHRLRQLGSGREPRARFLRRITAQRPRLGREQFGLAGLHVADPVAMAVAVEPSVVTRAERRRVTVELAGRHTRGQTTVDWFDQGGEAPNVEVVVEVDGARFAAMLSASVGQRGCGKAGSRPPPARPTRQA